MRLQESTIISANVATVWPHIADPVAQAAWNPKVISVDREKSGPAHFGERFEMIYRMSGRDNRSQVEVRECQPSQRIVFLHRIEQQSRLRIVEEAYDIEPHGDGVKVVQTIDLTRAGIPWLFRPLIWITQRFGHSTEEPYLERLKDLIERPTMAAATVPARDGI